MSNLNLLHLNCNTTMKYNLSLKTIKGVAILLYFGELDLVCPFLSGERFILNTAIKVSQFN